MSFGRSAVGAFVAQVVAVSAGGATAIVVARALGPSGKGEFTVLTWLAAILQQVGSLGLGPSNARLLVSDRARAADIIFQSLVVAVTIGSVLALGIGLWHYAGGVPSLRGVAFSHVLLALASVPAMQAVGYLQQVLLALRRISLYNSALTGFAVLQLVALVALWKAGSLTVTIAMVIYFGSSMLVLLLVLAALADQWRASAPRWSSSLLRASLGFGLLRHLIDMAELASRRIGLFVVAALAGSAASGYYSVAVALAELVWLLPVAVAPLLFTRVASDSPEAGARLTAQVCRVTLAASVGTVLALAVFGSSVVHLLFGGAFAPAAVMLKWMLPGVLLYIIPKTIGTFLLGRGITQTPAVVSALGLVVIVASALPLGRAYGGAGVAAASSLGMAVYALGVLAVVSRSSTVPILDYLVPRRADVPVLWRLFRGLMLPAERQSS